MRKFLLFLVSIVIGTVIVPATSYAHEIQSSGPIHVIFHVDPDDAPIINEQS